MHMNELSRCTARERVTTVMHAVFKDRAWFTRIFCNRSDHNGRSKRGRVVSVVTCVGDERCLVRDDPEQIRRFMATDTTEADIGCFGTKLRLDYEQMLDYRPEKYKESIRRRRLKHAAGAIRSVRAIEQMENVHVDRRTGEGTENDNEDRERDSAFSFRNIRRMLTPRNQLLGGMSKQ